MRGNPIIVRDCEGRALVRKIWEIGPGGVLVTTSELFDRLQSGDDSVFAIGFPATDCFKYVPMDEQEKIDWSRLEPFFVE